MVIGMLSFSSAFGQEKPEAGGGKLEQAAGAFVGLLEKGEFARATEGFDAAMHKVMPPQELEKTWRKVLEQAGGFKKQLGSRLEKTPKYDVVLVTCEFAKMNLDARLVFDKEGRITGLFFGPSRKAVPAGAEVWEGKLKAGAVEIRLVFHLSKQKDGRHEGTMDSPDQGAKGFALDEVSVKDDAVRLVLKSAGVVFEGRRSKDGQEIIGDFKQSGQSFPLTLKKVEKATELRRPQNPIKPYPYEEVQVAYENKKDGIKIGRHLDAAPVQGFLSRRALDHWLGPARSR
jgi:hypothetical protein